jgi:hypothetical protein
VYVEGGARKKKKTPCSYSLFSKQARQSATIFVVKFTFSLISFFFLAIAQPLVGRVIMAKSVSP